MERVTCPKCYSIILPAPLGCMCKPSTKSTSEIEVLNCTARQEDSGIAYQRCGGGRRVIRKKIGGD